jgi:hypothetical protein
LQITHDGSSSIWLEAPSSSDLSEGMIAVYRYVLFAELNVFLRTLLIFRPMGDTELLFLLANGHLPATQPYQAIMEGGSGRDYATKYLTGKKFTDTHPTTVVEFVIPVCRRFSLLFFCSALFRANELG